MITIKDNTESVEIVERDYEVYVGHLLPETLDGEERERYHIGDEGAPHWVDKFVNSNFGLYMRVRFNPSGSISVDGA